MFNKLSVEQLRARTRLIIEANAAAKAKAAQPSGLSVVSETSSTLSGLAAFRAQHEANILPRLAPVVPNAEQWEAGFRAWRGDSFCLIGPAGSGKSTTLKLIIFCLELAGRTAPIGSATKRLSPTDPGTIVTAFTRRAVSNAKEMIPAEIRGINIHKLVEYSPVYYDDPITGRKKMTFEPFRNAMRKLPAGIQTIAIDESGLTSTELHAVLIEALDPVPQIIYLGDIYQLPPVNGASILAAKLTTLDTVELSRVYRQSEDSPILDFAWKIKDGICPTEAELVAMKSPALSVHRFSESVAWDEHIFRMRKALYGLLDQGRLDFDRGDYVLIPFRKDNTFSINEMNPLLAQWIDDRKNNIVHEVIARGTTKYFAVGDKVLVDKQEAIITDIYPNPKYQAVKLPQPASNSLNRFGAEKKLKPGVARVVIPYGGSAQEADIAEDWEEDMDFELVSIDPLDTELKLQASHTLAYRFLADDSPEPTPLLLSTAGEILNLDLGYAMTVHSAQGTQAHTVVLCLHSSHRTMRSRELLYTAVTRAQKSLIIYADKNDIQTCIKNATIKGTTIAEKAKYMLEKLNAKAMAGIGEN